MPDESTTRNCNQAFPLRVYLGFSGLGFRGLCNAPIMGNQTENEMETVIYIYIGLYE